MKLAELLKTFTPPEPAELDKPKDEDDRQAHLAVAFQALKNCDLWIKNINVEQSVDMMEIEIRFFTTKPFPHTLTYENNLAHMTTMPLKTFAHGGYLQKIDPSW